MLAGCKIELNVSYYVIIILQYAKRLLYDVYVFLIHSFLMRYSNIVSNQSRITGFSPGWMLRSTPLRLLECVSFKRTSDHASHYGMSQIENPHNFCLWLWLQNVILVISPIEPAINGMLLTPSAPATWYQMEWCTIENHRARLPT